MAVVGKERLDQANTVELERFTLRYWLVADGGTQGAQRVHAAWEDPDTRTWIQVNGPISVEEAIKVIEGLR